MAQQLLDLPMKRFTRILFECFQLVSWHLIGQNYSISRRLRVSFDWLDHWFKASPISLGFEPGFHLDLARVTAH